MRLHEILKSTLLLGLMLVLAGCAGRGEIAPEDTAGSIFIMGFTTEGRSISELGHHYVFNFVDADDEPVTLTKRPRRNNHYILFDELPPGKWELVSFAARPAPGASGFAGTSMQARPVHLKFELEEATAHYLSQQLVVEHGRNAKDEITTAPRMAPLGTRVQERMERRAQRLGEHWVLNPEPIGELDPPERPTRRSFLERLFGD